MIYQDLFLKYDRCSRIERQKIFLFMTNPNENIDVEKKMQMLNQIFLELVEFCSHQHVDGGL